ncbi:MAG: hypothetical protein JNM56_00235 [Planctomycetia bacterium]|nr:hypothetical protein [Planctomycetia bacterium]
MQRWWVIACDWLLCRLRFTGDFTRCTFDPSDVRLMGIALQRTTPCTTHAGVVYRDTAGVLRVLHFAYHEMLRDEPCRGPFIFAIPALQDEDQEYLAEFCSRVYRVNQRGKLPYSFSFDPNLTFDRTGLVVLNQNSGFTCSTFVVALFRSTGNPLVDSSTWPRSADAVDIAARKYLLDAWRASGRPNLVTRASEIEPSIQTMRISPEQVAGAGLQRRLPTGYFRATFNGAEVLRRFATFFGQASP